MHNSAYVLVNGTYKFLRDFNIQTDPLISARRPGLIIITKKRTCKIVDFAVPADIRGKVKENGMKDYVLYANRLIKFTIILNK